MDCDELRYFPVERLREFSTRVFGHFGVPPADAARAANVLAAADLRGVDSHGVARLRTYADMLALGRINPRPKGEPIRPGWAVDRDGRPATRPEQMTDGGALLPLGSTREAGGLKGFCLAAAVDMVSCVLSGANWGPFAPPFALRQEEPARSVGRGIGHAFGALRIDGFIDPAEFRRQMDDWVRTMRSTKPAAGTPGVV